MQKVCLKITSIFMLVILSSSIYGQGINPKNLDYSDISISIDNGSVYTNLQKHHLRKDDVLHHLPVWLGLNSHFSFKEMAQKKDDLGFVHITLVPFYKNIKVSGNMLILHFKDEFLVSINGRMNLIQEDLNIIPRINEELATTAALEILEVSELVNHFPAELVIRNFEHVENPRLTWKIRIDGFAPKENRIKMVNVFVDAISGKVLQSINLMAHADVNASAKTLYRGDKTITTDDFSGGYRLRDNGRKIETYNVGGSEINMSPFNDHVFETPKDYINTSVNWTDIPTLMSLSLNNASNYFLSDLGMDQNTYTFLASVIGIGDLARVDDIEIINQNLPLEIFGPSDLPFIQEGLFIPVDTNQAYMSAFLKMELDMSNSIIEVSDSLIFELPILQSGFHNWSQSLENNGNYIISDEKNPALDVHWGMGKVYDYFETTFNRSSYDGQNSVLRNYVNGVMAMTGTNANAAALPSPYNSMLYGMGNGVYMNPVVSLDIVAHEFTHMLTEHNGNGGLEYQGESGALNESFSDMFGVMVDFFADSSQANWLMGEEVTIGGLAFRSLSDPKILATVNSPYFPPQPDTYQGQYWMNTNSQVDNGGVHVNSGVPNKWFYLLTAGGSGVNDKNDAYFVSEIGMEKSSEIIYRTLMNYITPTAQFIDAYNATIQAAEDLFGPQSTEVISVKDAWFAVGLGEKASSVKDINTLKYEVDIYPNPASTEFVIENKSSSSINATIVSIMGSSIMNIDVKQGTNKISTETFSKGVYLIKMDKDGMSFTEKIVIQ